jgi:hypothetical protein
MRQMRKYLVFAQPRIFMQTDRSTVMLDATIASPGNIVDHDRDALDPPFGAAVCVCRTLSVRTDQNILSRVPGCWHARSIDVVTAMTMRRRSSSR